MLKEILEQHKLWLESDGSEGMKANLRSTDLRGADLCYADLCYADLRYADLCHANLRYADLRGAKLRGADLRDTNLRGANLRDANLREANLCDVDLRDAIGNNSEIKTIQAGTYIITYTKDVVQIGCKRYTKDEWFSFTDNEINDMDSNALAWWKVWKPILKQILEIEQC